MKQKLIIIFSFALLIFFTGCTDSKYPLNGIWTADVNYNDCVAAFDDDICFLQFGEYIDKVEFTYKNGEGRLIDSTGEWLDFTVKGNVLTILVDDQKILLNKNTKAKPAPAAVKGAWNGPEGWMLIFISNEVFLVRDRGFADYGTYVFENNSGSFKSVIWEYDVNFLINGDILDAVIKSWYEENVTFTRAQNTAVITPPTAP